MNTPRKLQDILTLFSDKEKRMVLSAYEAAEEALRGKMRSNSHPFIEHPLAVAHILCREIGLRSDAVVATLLHEANRFQASQPSELNHTSLLESFRAEYPHDIIEIVEGLNNISNVQLQQANLDEERYRKLIISYSTDPRVILIKLADRLEVMRSISILPPAKRMKKLMETMMLYIPLAHQLGMYRIKSEMEDIFLKFTEPERYKEIVRKIKDTEPQREALVRNFINPLKDKLDREGIQYTLKARTKSPYSIWKKMQKQQISFDKVYDLFAMRFIIDCEPVHEIEEALCWKVYSLVTEEYEPDTSRLRDWISKPRDNGYESLHTTVQTKEGMPVEVQIRTTRMDYNAEQGGAAHWSYKGIKGGGDRLNEWLGKVRELMQSGDEEEKYEHASIALQELLVYTPTGDLRQLRVGSTVLDFAFEIHSNLGLRCTGARVNGKMCSIREKLHTGDVVEIISSKNQKPTADWLNFVVSSKARSKIKQKLKEEENARAAAGKELLARRLKNWKLVITDSDLHSLSKKYKFGNINEFFGAIGDSQFDVAAVKEYLQGKLEALQTAESRTSGSEHPEKTTELTASSGDFLIDRKLSGVELKLAKCCMPAYGDPIFGFVTIRDGIKIHRENCPNATRLRENYPYRMIEVRWKPKKKDGEKGDTHKRRQG
ncbi:MAG: bifunctional (p)ppGpp synthetase/guanosine-3',5'-bis(diphosphate) 3'-pyrophosphohydrolase [Bacteroidales bacterium]|nr:bifunctional (p)ppGpp synthetase/guanosine-3',5'-bis(diphosphate) 3'-pyrophosphohydrolase [Bacteroidales bacterium]